MLAQQPVIANVYQKPLQCVLMGHTLILERQPVTRSVYLKKVLLNYVHTMDNVLKMFVKLVMMDLNLKDVQEDMENQNIVRK